MRSATIEAIPGTGPKMWGVRGEIKSGGDSGVLTGTVMVVVFDEVVRQPDVQPANSCPDNTHVPKTQQGRTWIALDAQRVSFDEGWMYATVDSTYRRTKTGFEIVETWRRAKELTETSQAFIVDGPTVRSVRSVTQGPGGLGETCQWPDGRPWLEAAK